MVSYYNPVSMYRQQSAVGASVSPAAPQFHRPASPSTPAWYGGYHHQSQINPHQAQYCMQETAGGNQQFPPAAATATSWQHHHPMFHQDYADFPPIAPGANTSNGEHILGPDPGLPSPPITVSAGSDMSSPGAHGGSVSPPQNLQQAKTIIPPVMPPIGRRSPYEWMRKPSYQSQPNPEVQGGAPLTSTPSLLDFTSTDAIGKTRTKDKYRVVYTDHQRLELEKEFHYSRYITIRRKAELASNLGLSERQVKIWFQNRRAKERKQVKKREELSQKDFKIEPGTAAHEAMLASHAALHHQAAAAAGLHQQLQQHAAVANAAAVAANMHPHSQLHQHQLHQPSLHQLCTPD